MDAYLGTYDENGGIAKMPALDLAGNYACRNYTIIGIDRTHFVMAPPGMAPHLQAEGIAAVRAYLAGLTAKRKAGKGEDKADTSA